MVSFAGKARSAIGLVGKGGDLVLWYEGDGTWATSRAFASARTPLVERVLGQLAPEKLIARPWDRVLPAARYRFADDAPGERLAVPWWSNRFPHPLVPARRGTAAGDAAAAAGRLGSQPDARRGAAGTGQPRRWRRWRWGRGWAPTSWRSGFSSLDVVGHSFGPRSHEVQDALVRLDRLLGQLLALLDRKVGRGRYVLALTSDHGVAAHPEADDQPRAQDAGRVPLARVARAPGQGRSPGDRAGQPRRHHPVHRHLS